MVSRNEMMVARRTQQFEDSKVNLVLKLFRNAHTVKLLTQCIRRSDRVSALKLYERPT